MLTLMMTGFMAAVLHSFFLSFLFLRGRFLVVFVTVHFATAPSAVRMAAHHKQEKQPRDYPDSIICKFSHIYLFPLIASISEVKLLFWIYHMPLVGI